MLVFNTKSIAMALFSFHFLFFALAEAAPSSFMYQGRIVGIDGKPLEYEAVAFEFTIASHDGGCVLYKEIRGGVDMRNSKGVFDTPIGAGTKSYPTAPSSTLLDAFDNSKVLNCEGGGTYTPLLNSGRVLRVQFYDGKGWRLVTPDSLIRSVPYAGFANQADVAQKLEDKTVNDFVLKPASCTVGQSVVFDGTGFTCSTISGGGGGGSGTVTGVTSANSYLTVASGTTTPFLTVNVGTTAGTVAAGNDSRFTDSRNPSGAAGGDLAVSYPNPTVAKIQGRTVSATAPADGQALLWDNGSSTWIPQYVRMQDVRNSWGGSQMIPSSACSANQAMVWSAVIDRFTCQSIGSLNASAITAGVLDPARLGTGTASASTYLRGDGTWSSVSTSDATKLPLAGGTMAGNIDLNGNKILNVSNVPFVATNPGPGEAGQSLRWNGSAWEWFTAGAAGAGIATLNGQTGNTQSFSPSASATSYGFSSSANVHTFTIPSASTAGVTAGTISKTDYDSFSAKQAAGNYITAMTGDVTSSGFTSGSVTTTIANNAVTTVKIADGNVTGVKLENSGVTANTYTKVTVDAKGRVTAGASLAATDIPSLDAAKITSGVLDSARLGSGTASASTYLRGDGTWSAVPSFTESDPKVGGNTTNYVSKWDGSALVASGIYESGGKVGIGTSNPAGALDVRGGTASSGSGLPINIVSQSGVTGSTSSGGAINITSGSGYMSASYPNSNYGAINFVGGTHTFQANNPFSASPLFIFSTATDGLFQNSGVQTFLKINPSIVQSGTAGYTAFQVNANESTAGSGTKLIADFSYKGTSRAVIAAGGNVGIGTTSPSEALEVVGKVKATQLCIGTDCKSAWPAAGGSGTVTSVIAGAGLTGGTISTTGTLAVDVGTTDGKIVQVAAGGRLPALDGSNLTNISASQIDAGTLPIARGGTGQTSASGALNALLPAQSAGQFLKTDGSNSSFSLLRITDVKGSSAGNPAFFNVSGACTAGEMLTYSAVTDQVACAAYSLPTSISDNLWSGSGGDVYRATGNVGVGTASPGSPLTVAGIIESTSGGIKFPDGSIQTTASAPSGTAKMALIVRTTSQTVPNTSTVTVSGFDTVVYDTGSFFSAGSPDRFVIPSGVTHIRLTGAMGWAYNTTGMRYIAVYKNGATVYSYSGGTWSSVAQLSSAATDAAGRASFSSPIIPVMAGDYFQLVIHQQSGGNLNLAGASFGIEAVNGSTVTASGSGTANYIPRWTSSTGLADSPIAISGSNVGIGTSSPATTADISGGMLRVQGGVSYGSYPSTGKGVEVGYDVTSDSGLLAAYDRGASAHKALFVDGSTLNLNSLSNANVGIGTYTPTAKLHVGNSSDSYAFFNFNNNGSIPGSGIGLMIGANQSGINGETNFWNGYQAALTSFDFKQKTGVATYTTLMTVKSNGNVGIGTTNPAEKLEVSGNIKLSGTITQDPWVNVTYQNGWEDYGLGYAPVSYFKDKNGIVHLRGVMKNGTCGSTSFTLPAGYRPAYRGLFTTQSNTSDTFTRFDILADGSGVSITNCANGWLSVDGITFLAEQ